MSRLRLAVAALALTFAACGGKPKDAAAAERPKLPPLSLHPMLQELQALADRPIAPDESAQKTLREYADVALQIVEADARTAALAERALLEDPNAWFALEPAITHDDVAVRRRAAWLCGRSGQTILVLPLLLRLKYESDPETVVWVADALQRLGNDAALAWLDAAIGDERTAQQAGSLAIAALQERSFEVPAEPTWDDLRRLLREAHAKWRATGLTSRPDTAQPDPMQLETRLARHLVTPSGWQLRPIDDARYVMRLAGQLAVPMLARTAHAEEHYMRTTPLQIMAELGPAAKAAMPDVLPLLQDPLTSAYAVRALGEMGDPGVLPHLRPLLTDRETELRAAAAQALGLLADEQSRPALEARLNDPNEVMDVRVNAAFGLLCLGAHPAAQSFLDEREAKHDYHEPTLARLKERLAAR